MKNPPSLFGEHRCGNARKGKKRKLCRAAHPAHSKKDGGDGRGEQQGETQEHQHLFRIPHHKPQKHKEDSVPGTDLLSRRKTDKEKESAWQNGERDLRNLLLPWRHQDAQEHCRCPARGKVPERDALPEEIPDAAGNHKGRLCGKLPFFHLDIILHTWNRPGIRAPPPTSASPRLPCALRTGSPAGCDTGCRSLSQTEFLSFSDGTPHRDSTGRPSCFSPAPAPTLQPAAPRALSTCSSGPCGRPLPSG